MQKLHTSHLGLYYKIFTNQQEKCFKTTDSTFAIKLTRYLTL